MRFNSEAYGKLYPRKEVKEEVETVVDTFDTTKDESVEEEKNGNGKSSESDT